MFTESFLTGNQEGNSSVQKGEVMSSFIDDVSLRDKLNIHFKHTQHVTYLIFRNESHRYTLSPQMFIALFNIF